ncbi:hypothetical protein KCP78_19040 [Salmonella enterica subsp. enterica]|nr:hypothetical protein KCP78_19040 [Salmonella enterica subsp. enterica]
MKTSPPPTPRSSPPLPHPPAPPASGETRSRSPIVITGIKVVAFSGCDNRNSCYCRRLVGLRLKLRHLFCAAMTSISNG